MSPIYRKGLGRARYSDQLSSRLLESFQIILVSILEHPTILTSKTSVLLAAGVWKICVSRKRTDQAGELARQMENLLYLPPYSSETLKRNSLPSQRRTSKKLGPYMEKILIKGFPLAVH